MIIVSYLALLFPVFADLISEEIAETPTEPTVPKTSHEIPLSSVVDNLPENFTWADKNGVNYLTYIHN